jgi:hypothetical protein
MPEASVTTDHNTIRKWAEERGGHPASVAGTAGGKDEAGILRLDFDPRDKDLEEVSWDEFFEKFDKEKLAFLYQDKTEDGSISRFHKFVNRSTAQKKAH